MVYWRAGNWHTPESGSWKCLVDHDGVFDTRIMGYATEELWFTEWENGGTPYDNPEGYENFNPINHVNDWRVPMLVIHGQLARPEEHRVGKACVITCSSRWSREPSTHKTTDKYGN